MKRRKLVILGSTGSIGVNALKLVDQYPDRFEVTALSAAKNTELLAQQIAKYKPKRAAIADAAAAKTLSGSCNVLSGETGLTEVAASPEADLVINAVVGFAGVKPTLAAINAGKDVALANKESIVAAGPLIKAALHQRKTRLIPIDSEHSAIFQVLDRQDASKRGLRRLLLTASGGPFLHLPTEQLRSVTPEQALRHPTWSMGNKITIDSATMMNKGLEVIEATRLFDVDAEKVGVVVHPESVIHSMVEYVDGSILAQLGITDMRGPLAYAMAYPERLEDALPSLDFAKVGKFTFLEPDTDKFPCLKLAYAAAKQDGSMPAILNAANEICVAAFLEKRIGFTDIARIIAQVMERHPSRRLTNLEELCEMDQWARAEAQLLIKGAQS